MNEGLGDLEEWAAAGLSLQKGKTEGRMFTVGYPWEVFLSRYVERTGLKPSYMGAVVRVEKR